ncbi:MAG: HU family DNA-binding protein [Muribaculaceae bacterium]|nr:HU family DNA-binding protein [Muribaculaceae bacterium]
MDKNEFTKTLADKAGLETDEIESLMTAFNDILKKHSLNLDSIAIPSLGRFEPEKHEETIVTDHVTGKKLLLPPEIVLNFKSSTSLRKRIAQ